MSMIARRRPVLETRKLIGVGRSGDHLIWLGLGYYVCTPALGRPAGEGTVISADVVELEGWARAVLNGDTPTGGVTDRTNSQPSPLWAHYFVSGLVRALPYI
ncbi:hypothetical protein SAICODRAFT_103360 [Saitoella complicata NRRL Y-17804]|uniref:uncharacterized protein n=1 Tax=Saitoella complicata (strain BCRC 22490 / CBS 7301 / JCM 7358 / NBRC 10748 / NRRL Y-17804) TaxID=698492 RepID=UPI0008668605|nr:uncharacterized protein SAICODRAFT_103360 [Saitoella complicata NRRL Y-17804]ODQ56184.1 hypothetical protein SAICODRAFT_103360 [Saitoella complicata NRRL Y-17804]